MPPEALGAAHAEYWRATDEVVEVAGGHLDAHRGHHLNPDDPRVMQLASHPRWDDQASSFKVAWMEGNGRSPPHVEHAAARQPPSHMYYKHMLPQTLCLIRSPPEELADGCRKALAVASWMRPEQLLAKGPSQRRPFAPIDLAS